MRFGSQSRISISLRLDTMVYKSLWLVFSMFLFAGMFTLSKSCAQSVSVYEIMFYRAVIGLIFIGVILYKKRIAIGTKHFWAHFSRGFFGTATFLCELIALTYLPLGLEQTLSNTAPLIFSLFIVVECLLNKKGIDWWLLGAILVGFVGVVIILRPDVTGINLTGVFFALGAATCFAITSLCLRNLGVYREPTERTVFYLLCFNLFVGATGTVVTTGFSFHTPFIFLALLGVGLAGGVAQITQTIAWTYGHALVNSVFQFSGIVFSVLFGFFFFHEVLDIVTFLGIAIVLTASICAVLIRRKN